MVTGVSEQLFEAVKRTLRYYALFRYPIDLNEIHRHCELKCSAADIEDTLNELTQAGIVSCHDGYYSLSPDIESLLSRRLAGNQTAAQLLDHAKTTGRFISRFPFVRFVGISGSLSKGFITEKSDYDYFIITATNRLWICRTFLHLFKKLTFLTGQQHRFCMNYFIDESAILLEEKNIYTATELSTLVPVCGKSEYDALMQANSWVRQSLPNLPTCGKNSHIPGSRKGFLKGLAEWTIDRCSPGYINKWLMNFTDRRWKEKWGRVGYPREDYSLAFKTTLHISKNHPSNYQKRILEELNQKKK